MVAAWKEGQTMGMMSDNDTPIFILAYPLLECVFDHVNGHIHDKFTYWIRHCRQIDLPGRS